MKIGIIREDKIPHDERVPLAPEQCRELLDSDPDLRIEVQISPIRRYLNEEYDALGIPLVEKPQDCDVLMGVKEVPIEKLLPNNTYLFFSHTIKKQEYNKKLLQAVLEKNIRLIDYETLVNKRGSRLLGFGRFAGIVGAYNAFFAWGQRHGSFNLKRAYKCEDREEMEAQLVKVDMPNIKIALTGRGRVAGGAIEILEKLNIKKVSPQDFLNKEFDEPVYTQLSVTDYNKRKEGEGSMSDFFKNPTMYEGNFGRFTKVADMYIACHYWDHHAPFILTKEALQASDNKLQVVADISCDIDAPVACTIRPSTIEDPIYGYDPKTGKEVDPKEGITVMAVDNLPCELPRDASWDFGSEFIQKVLPAFQNNDLDGILQRATIAKNGSVTERFAYLREWLES